MLQRKEYVMNKLGTIPHQKFCFYHLPTRGRAGTKLGDAWYVSNVSIIFYCSMLLYYLFWMLMGLFIHFYIIFGTNLQPKAPCKLLFFSYFSVLQKRNIKRNPNGMKPSVELFLEQTWSRGLGVDVKKETREPRGREGRLPTWVRPHPRGRPGTLVAQLFYSGGFLWSIKSIKNWHGNWTPFGIPFL